MKRERLPPTLAPLMTIPGVCWMMTHGSRALGMLASVSLLKFADSVVDGTATWNTGSGRVTAQVKVKGPHSATTTLRMRWNDLARHPRASLSGHTGSGSRLTATLPAP